ncbi:unnamed protein product [Ixodes persulcatus]
MRLSKYRSHTTATASTSATALKASVLLRTMSFRTRMVASAKLLVLCPRVVILARKRPTPPVSQGRPPPVPRRPVAVDASAGHLQLPAYLHCRRTSPSVA